MDPRPLADALAPGATETESPALTAGEDGTTELRAAGAADAPTEATAECATTDGALDDMRDTAAIGAMECATATGGTEAAATTDGATLGELPMAGVGGAEGTATGGGLDAPVLGALETWAEPFTGKTSGASLGAWFTR